MESHQESTDDFEDVKWTSIAKQFKAYQKQHPKSLLKSLPDFAANVLAHPSHYASHTVKRATFYQKKEKKNPSVTIPDEESGGELAIKEVKDLVNASYEAKHKDVPEFDVDHELSSDKVKVYKRKGNSKQAVVVHRGTKGLADVALDAAYALGHDISKSERAKHSRAIQKKAEARYGAENVSTVGHSLGAKLGSVVGNDSHEIINVNKAVAPQDMFKPIAEKETNIRTKYDPVSALLALQGHKNTFTIPSISVDPFAEHSTDALDRVDAKQSFGRD